MSCLSIISLEEAKVYLRIDDTLTEDDRQITRMINGAFDYIERWTNVLVYSRSKTYLVIDGCAVVYDAPINALVSPTNAVATVKHGFSNYTTDITETELKVNVGYTTASNVPNDLVEVAYELIDLMYYQHETGKTIEKDLSELSINILNKHKRFLF